jgi:hypothetical protein
VALVDVDTDDATLPLGLRALKDIIVLVLLVAERIEPLKDKFEERLEVLGARRRHKDVRVAVSERGGDRETKGGRFSTTAAGRQRHS